MQLQILISKKGTKVVTATNLHRALQLPDYKYNSHVDRWLSDVYAFSDDVRKPSELKDYAVRQRQYSKQKDFYLSIELAKLITLNSESEHKLRFARELVSIESKERQDKTFSKDQVLAVIELTKVMGLISCQKTVEKLHHQAFESNKGSMKQWWKYRANLLGYSVDELKSKMMEIGKNYKGKNFIQMLMQVDKYEVIRMAVIDLFMALGKSRAYATEMGSLAKIFASEMNVEIWDDRGSSIDFGKKRLNPQLIQQVKALNSGATLRLW